MSQISSKQLQHKWVNIGSQLIPISYDTMRYWYEATEFSSQLESL